MKTTRQLLETMVKTAMTTKSHRSERYFNNNKAHDIWKYITTSPTWEDVTSDMDVWNSCEHFVNSDGQLRLSFIIDKVVCQYTPQFKKGL